MLMKFMMKIIIWHPQSWIPMCHLESVIRLSDEKMTSEKVEKS